MIVSNADSVDDGDWFGANLKRRYRVRDTRNGGWWLIRRRGLGVLLRSFAQRLPHGLPDTDDALRVAWFAAAWPDLDPRTRADLIKEARKAERTKATGKQP